MRGSADVDANADHDGDGDGDGDGDEGSDNDVPLSAHAGGTIRIMQESDARQVCRLWNLICRNHSRVWRGAVPPSSCVYCSPLIESTDSLRSQRLAARSSADGCARAPRFPSLTANVIAYAGSKHCVWTPVGCM